MTNRRTVKMHDAMRFKRTIRQMIREEIEDLLLHKMVGTVDYLYQSGNNYFADVFLNGVLPKFQDTFATFNNWTTVSGSFTVNGGTAASSAATQDLAIVTNSSFSDLTFLCQVFLPSITSGTEVEIIVRYQDTSNYYALVFTNGSLLLRKTVGGTVTNIASASVTFTANTWYWLRIQAQDTRLTAWTSATGAVGTWGSMIQATDSTFSSGSVGIRDVSIAAQFKSPTVYTGVTPAIPVRPLIGSYLYVGQEVFVERINFNGMDLLVDMPRVI